MRANLDLGLNQTTCVERGRNCAIAQSDQQCDRRLGEQCRSRTIQVETLARLLRTQRNRLDRRDCALDSRTMLPNMYLYWLVGMELDRKSVV